MLELGSLLLRLVTVLFLTDDCVVAVVSVDVDNFQVAVVGGFA